jgi:hypothetical protein
VVAGCGVDDVVRVREVMSHVQQEGNGEFWKYDPEAFLKQPVYSRDVPPCRYC